MTTQQKVMLGAALAAGAAAAAGVAYLMRGSDESGIRVKNGSVIILTHSNGGFKPKGSDWESKKSAAGCYEATVPATSNTQCTGPNPLSGITSLSFTSTDDQPHVIDFTGGRFTTKLKNRWDRVSNDRELRYFDALVRLASMRAENGSGQALECTFGGNFNDQVRLDICPQ